MFFVFTSGLSIYGLVNYRKNGSLPGSNSPSDPSSIEAQTRDAFSTADHHDGSHASGNMHDDDEDALLHSNEPTGRSRTGRPLSWGAEEGQGVEEYERPYHTEDPPYMNPVYGRPAAVIPYRSGVYGEPIPPEHGGGFETPYAHGGIVNTGSLGPTPSYMVGETEYTGAQGDAPPYRR